MQVLKAHDVRCVNVLCWELFCIGVCKDFLRVTGTGGMSFVKDS